MASHTADHPNSTLEDHPSDAPPEKKPRKESRDGDKGDVLESGGNMDEEQLLIRNGMSIEVHGIRHPLKPKLIFRELNFSTGFVKWSSKGTLLIAIYDDHIFIWEVGTALKPIKASSHSKMVRLIDLSPREDYMVTCCSDVTLNILDVETGKVKKTFEGDKNAFVEVEDNSKVSCPLIRWSGGDDAKYFALIEKNVLHIYETENFYNNHNFLGLENVTNFSWSPTDPVLALFSPASVNGDKKARVRLIEVPTGKSLVDLFMNGVERCKMYWQSAGDYFALTFGGLTQTNTNPRAGFLVVSVRENFFGKELKLLPKNIVDFAWEPKGVRFGVIHGLGECLHVSFYSAGDVLAGIRFKCCHRFTLKGVWANHLVWSPVGRDVVIAGWGNLKFFNVDEEKDEHKVLNTQSDTPTSIIQWSPTGRYLATSGFADNKRNVVKIWSSRGELLGHIETSKDVNQLLWRPKCCTQVGEIMEIMDHTSSTLLKLMETLRKTKVEEQSLSNEGMYGGDPTLHVWKRVIRW